MRMVLAAASAVVGLAAGHAPQKDRMSAGYNDGYAVGYSTTCNRQPLVIDGEWGNATYSEGYAAGVTDGTLACLAEG